MPEIDALLTKIMDNKHQRVYIKKPSPGARNGIYHRIDSWPNAELAEDSFHVQRSAD